MPQPNIKQITLAGLCLLVMLFALSGCGKKGPLYLPSPDNNTTTK